MNKAADPANKDKYRSTSVTIGGSGLDWHDVDSYFRPNAVGRYSFDAQKDIVFNKLDKLFDLAITTDCSQCPIRPQLKPIFSDQTARFAQTGSQARRRACFLHVLGLPGQARADGAARRGIHLDW
jgi:hypothetical protein